MNIISIFNMTGQEFVLDWQIGYHSTEMSQPSEWMPATVPGAVQLDVMKGKDYKQPWWYADNVRQFDWMEDVYFTYKSEFKKSELNSGERLFFFSKGIDYQFKIYLNGNQIGEQEGMFSYVNIDLTDGLKDNNELRIVLMPVPNLGFDYQENPSLYRKNARESTKPAVSYEWDWHPRAITRGIWDETFLVIKKTAHISDVTVSYILNEDLTQAKVQLNIEGTGLNGNKFKWLLKDPQGEYVLEKSGSLTSNVRTIECGFKNPLLWQPNGYGFPNLYTSEFYLLNEDNSISEQQICKVGFRRIRLIMNEGAWQEKQSMPVTRATAPASLEVNNRRIFAKGSNWVHSEVFIGTITPERYREQLLLAHNAHFNLLRVWGGGIVNKESFFDICDELGILVWQEFPLACNDYPDKPEYLKVLEQEARSIVNRVKKHACLAIWSGGNELFNNWSGITEQSWALRLLNSICFQLDPQTPFIYTSPIYGIGHGHYLFYEKETNEDVFQWMSSTKRTAYTEFGVPGVSNLDVLTHFIPENELFPPQQNTAWELHHGMGVWRKDSWLELPTLEQYFGKIQSLKELVQYSQLLQCEGLKFIYEEARRQKPYCSMALNWCYQEPWPSAANNNLINWPNEVKPAYYHVAAACRPVLASVRVPKFEWREGEDFSCDLFLLNDSYDKIDKSQITVTLKFDGSETELINWECSEAEAFTNLQGPTASIKIPHMKSNLFTITVTVKGKSEYNSTYTLLYSGKDIQKKYPPEEYYGEQL